MKPFLHDLLRVARLRSGRRVSLYQQWRPILDAHGLTEVLAYLERAEAHDRMTKELENRWKASRTGRRYSQDMAAIDAVVDQLLFGILKLAKAQTSGLAPQHDLVLLAVELERALFPAGVYAITGLPYVEQAVAVEMIVDRLHGPLAHHVSELGLAQLVARLAAAAVEYRHTLDGDNGTVLYTQVQTADRRGRNYMAEILCMTMAHFHDSDNPAHMAVRVQLLAPLVEQDRQARQDFRIRRARGEDGEDVYGDGGGDGHSDGDGGNGEGDTGEEWESGGPAAGGPDIADGGAIGYSAGYSAGHPGGVATEAVPGTGGSGPTEAVPSSSGSRAREMLPSGR